jgi:hypothetical protein
MIKVTNIFFCLIILFLILSFLEIRAERRQKSISVELSFAMVFACFGSICHRTFNYCVINMSLCFGGHITVTSRSHRMPFNFVIAARPLLILSLISGSQFPPLVILSIDWINYYIIAKHNGMAPVKDLTLPYHLPCYNRTRTSGGPALRTRVADGYVPRLANNYGA